MYEGLEEHELAVGRRWAGHGDDWQSDRNASIQPTFLH